MPLIISNSQTIEGALSHSEEEQCIPQHLSPTVPARPVTTTTSLQRVIYQALAVSVLLGLVSGTLYGYGRYSRDLKQVLKLSHFELELMGIFLDSGSYLGHPVVGYVFDHFGPRVTCLCGAVVVFLAYGMIHLIVSSVIDVSESSSFWLGSSFFLVGFGSGMGYTAALGSTTKNFQATPHYRSLAVGVVSAGYGLCSTLVGLSYLALGGLDYFFLFWAMLVAVVNLLGALVLGGSEPSGGGAEAATMTTTSTNPGGVRRPLDPVSQEGNQRQQQEDRFMFRGTHRSENDSLQIYSLMMMTEDRHHRYNGINNNHNEGAAISAIDPDLDVDDDRLTPRHKWDAIRSAEFWMLFAVFAGCSGCGLFIINNVSTIVQSLGGHDSVAGQLVILFSVCNCGGRIFVGYLADRPNMRKLDLFCIACLVMAWAMFLSAVTSLEYALPVFFVTVTLMALAYGGIWVLIVGIVSDWYGVHNFGKNYGVVAMGPALLGMILNSASAWMYELHTDEKSTQHQESQMSSVCWGTVCYHGSFVLAGCVAILSLLFLCGLSYRRKSKSAGATTPTILFQA